MITNDKSPLITEFHYLVDGGVVDDLVGEPDALLGELLARLVGDLHGALDAPAESVGLRQLHGYGAPGVGVSVLLERLDHIACKIGPAPTPSSIDRSFRKKNQRIPPAPRAAEAGRTYWCTPGS